MAVIWVDNSCFWFCAFGEMNLIDELFFFDGWETKKINIMIIISIPQPTFAFYYLRKGFDISQPNCEFRQEKARNITARLMWGHIPPLLTVLNRQQTLLIKAGCDRRSEIHQNHYPTASSDGKVHSGEFRMRVHHINFHHNTYFFFIHVPSDLSLARRPSITFNPICYLFFIRTNAFMSMRSTRLFWEQQCHDLSHGQMST